MNTKSKGFTPHLLKSSFSKQSIGSIIALKTKKSSSLWKKGRGFTLIELLVVVAIIGLIASIVLVNLTGNTDKAKLARAKQFHGQVTHALQHEAVGIWRFEETTGPTSRDSSGYGKHGTWSASGVTSKAETSSECAPLGLGRCLDFDGSNGFITVPNMDFNVITVAIWVKRDTIGGISQYLFVSTTIHGWGVYFSVINTVNFTRFGTDDSSSTNTITDTNNWHHIVVSYNGSTICFYIDGKKDSCISPSPSWLSFNNGGNNYRIGSIGASNFFNGLMDEIYVFNQALTTAQIQQLYAEGLKRHLIAQE